MNAKSGEPISRRQFLKGSALAAGAVASAVVLPPIVAAMAEKSRYDALSLEEKFNEKGIGDFYPFYKVAKEGLEKYRALPEFSAFNSYYFDLYTLLDSFSNGGGSLEESMLDRLRKDWGTGVSEIPILVKAKVDSLKIEIGPDSEDTTEGVRVAYGKLANVFGYNSLVTPNKLVISGGGGDIEWYARPEALIRAESPANNLEGFYRTMIHEFDHGEGNWTSGKPYIERKKFLEFCIFKAKTCYGVMDRYFNGSWEDAQIFKEGRPLLMLYTETDPNMDMTIAMENSLKRDYGVDVEQYKLDVEKMNDNTDRYNRYVYTVVKHGYELLKKPESARDQKETSFLNYTFGLTVYRAMNEVDHYLVGPVQREGLGLPGKNYLPAWPDSYLTKANEELMLARWRAFTNLDQSELADFSTANAALRRRLGLGED